MSKRYLNRRSAMMQREIIENRTRRLLATGAIPAAIWDDPAALREERASLLEALKIPSLLEETRRSHHMKIEVIERRLGELKNPVTLVQAAQLRPVEVLYRRAAR